MKTKLNPKEVLFDEKGYEDLVNKIENLELKHKENQELVANLSFNLQNIFKNLSKTFTISNEDFEALMTLDMIAYFSQDDSLDTKPTLRARH